MTKYCRHVDPCFTNPCLNNGTCARDMAGGYECDCSTTGFHGSNCSIGNAFIKATFIILNLKINDESRGDWINTFDTF